MEAKNIYQLARLAECADPDNETSPGAAFLLSVQGDVQERMGYEYTDLDDITEMAYEIADNAPSIYTYTRWQEFVDLAAWQEDIDMFGASDDMTQAAAVALYMIAERLASALFAELITEAEEMAT